MNYYKQGDAAKADKIKAAFEKLGVSDLSGYNFGNGHALFYTYDCGGSKVIAIVCVSLHVANIIKTHPDYQELELPIEPKSKFKVGDWIVQNDNGTVSQITKTINGKDEYGEYRAYEHTNGYFHEVFENEYHLWSIADAKDGDILSAKIDGDDYILIFKQIKDGWIETYGHYYITIDKFCAPTQMFCRNYQGRLYPATQEQYKTLFKKMRDDGYEWDFDKNELKKIHPHYNITNFNPFDKVLVRCSNDEEWMIEFYCKYDTLVHTSPHRDYPFMGIGDSYSQCIPFEGNERLLGTTDMPSEEYINW